MYLHGRAKIANLSVCLKSANASRVLVSGWIQPWIEITHDTVVIWHKEIISKTKKSCERASLSKLQWHKILVRTVKKYIIFFFEYYSDKPFVIHLKLLKPQDALSYKHYKAWSLQRAQIRKILGSFLSQSHRSFSAWDSWACWTTFFNCEQYHCSYQ